MKKFMLSFQSEFRRWYARISLVELSSNATLTREIEDLETELRRLINEVQ